MSLNEADKVTRIARRQSSDRDGETLIGDLGRLHLGYTLPWAFMLNEHGDLYVRGDYPVRPQSGGTLNWPIGRGNDGLLYTTEAPPDLGSRRDMSHAVRHFRAERVYLIDRRPPAVETTGVLTLAP